MSLTNGRRLVFIVSVTARANQHWLLDAIGLLCCNLPHCGSWNEPFTVSALTLDSGTDVVPACIPRPGQFWCPLDLRSPVAV
jgi:hypothetical protein